MCNSMIYLDTSAHTADLLAYFSEQERLDNLHSTSLTIILLPYNTYYILTLIIMGGGERGYR